MYICIYIHAQSSTDRSTYFMCIGVFVCSDLTGSGDEEEGGGEGGKEEEEEEESEAAVRRRKPWGDTAHFCPVALKEQGVLWPGNEEYALRYCTSRGDCQRQHVYRLSNRPDTVGTVSILGPMSRITIFPPLGQNILIFLPN